MRNEKEIRERLKEFKEEKITLTRCSSQSRIRELNRKIRELEWVLEIE